MSTDPASIASGDAVITARGAAARVGNRLVWSDVDLDVGAGEFVAVLGPNGVGKSTLIKALLGQIPLASGTLRVLGQPAGEANREIGYLPQRRAFDPSVRLRGLDVVQLGLDGHRWGVAVSRHRRREDRARVRDVVELVGAGDYAHRPIGELSGGEQQRLLIAQALVNEPALLLLDEPLDSLDLPNQAGVSALLSSISRQRGITIVLVAHDVNPILGYLDMVVYLGGGRAVCGAPDAVVTSETLTSLYGAPVEVLQASDGRLVVVGQPEAPAHHADRHGHG